MSNEATTRLVPKTQRREPSSSTVALIDIGPRVLVSHAVVQKPAQTLHFWSFTRRDLARQPKLVFHALLERVAGCPSAKLYDAVEEGVPTSVVILFANALGHKSTWAMDLVGVSESTFRRKEEASEPLPEVAGHRAMGFLRIVATLKRLLQESGDPQATQSFDFEGWVSDWVKEPLPEFGGKTPADMLRNPEGQRAVEELLERMRGGVAA